MTGDYLSFVGLPAMADKWYDIAIKERIAELDARYGTLESRVIASPNMTAAEITERLYPGDIAVDILGLDRYEDGKLPALGPGVLDTVGGKTPTAPSKAEKPKESKPIADKWAEDTFRNINRAWSNR